jgi:hypothetical protein
MEQSKQKAAGPLGQNGYSTIKQWKPMTSELDNSWSILIQLKAVKSETEHTYIHTYTQCSGNVGELLDS